jgi:phosphoribosyl 1,2-cyclic phosphodiesterase
MITESTTVQVHSLASGSSGNAVLITSDERGLLIDAGISGRALSAGMRARGIRADQLDGVLLTHEHDDHMRGAEQICKKMNAPIIANRATLEAANRRAELAIVQELASGDEVALGPFVARSFRVPHDAAEPVGYVVSVHGIRIACVTDAGRVTRSMREALKGAHLCIIESNHDVDWLMRGPYPHTMKARIAGENGHLSNKDAVELMHGRLEEDGPCAFWLAHLSDVNNSPRFARKFVLNELKSRTSTPFNMEIALRDRPSVSWRLGATAVQRSLFGEW